MRFLKTRALIAALTALQLAASPAAAADTRFTIAPVVTGLDAPWALAHLPDGGILITEKDGRLLHWHQGTLRQINGTPNVVDAGQGGLLDITLPRDFATSREVWLTYAKPQGRGSGTALATATLSADNTRLNGLRDLIVMSPGSSGGRHFGSRVVEAPDGTLFLTIGDRGDSDTAQDRARHNGSILRIHRDGSIPADNPFVTQPGILPEIWSFGHRNAQGADVDAAGQLWTAEHGARGGDEINLIRKGANYGWPVISYGRHYSGAKIGIGTASAGMEQPALYWDPSMAPSGLIAYQGNMFPDWQGDLFVGSLKFDYIARIEISGDTAREAAQIKSPETNRVRDLATGPDGAIWFLSVGNGTLYRIAAP